MGKKTIISLQMSFFPYIPKPINICPKCNIRGSGASVVFMQ